MSVTVSKPVHWSTTVTGERAVLVTAAQPGIRALKSTTRWAQAAHWLGFMGMSCATRTFMSGLLARICSTSLV